MTDKQAEKEPKQYFERVPRKLVYSGLVLLALTAAGLYLCVPHYRPLKLATAQQTADAHRDIIRKYFIQNTNCKDDKLDKAERIKTFNKYFKTNQYGNRAVFRGCNDKDVLLAKDDSGQWQKTVVQVKADLSEDEPWEKTCLIDDILDLNDKRSAETRRSVKMLQNTINFADSVSEENTKICNALAKESYIEVNLRTGIHFHF